MWKTKMKRRRAMKSKNQKGSLSLMDISQYASMISVRMNKTRARSCKTFSLEGSV